MKNSVDLYQPKYQPKLRLLSLSIALILWLFTAVCCGFVYFYMSYQQQQSTAEFANLESQKQQQDLLFNELSGALNTRSVSPTLLNQVDKNQKIINHKKQILSEISGQEELKTNGFSKLMSDLAYHHQKGLWLTHINLNGLDVMMEGAANESAIIPKWLSALGQTDYFKGQEFADTRLYRDTDQQLNFIIATGKNLTDEKSELNDK